MVEKGIKEILNRLKLSDKSVVLDLGCFGKGGENGSEAIVDNFYENGKIVGVCNHNKLKKLNYPKINLIEGDYFEENIQGKYDLIYVDLGAEGQINVIENEIEKKLYKKLNPNGVLIFYTFSTSRYHQYRVNLTKEKLKLEELIKTHLSNYWEFLDSFMDKKYINSLLSEKTKENYQILFIDQEKKRDYIYWVTLKKIK